MKRNVSLEDISDGKLYEANDLVKADCGGCDGCSACCQGMGQSVILDPLDVHRLVNGLNMSMEQLLQDKLELNVVDGIILPNLQMNNRQEACGFLNENGRCSIHPYRPGICRLFPLGRYYENGSFKYFLQINECRKQNRFKVKVKKWIDTPQLKEYEQFVADWHYFLNDVEELLKKAEGEMPKTINMYILQQFYMKAFMGDDFYGQFAVRMQEARQALGL